jgi:hypothetical protein
MFDAAQARIAALEKQLTAAAVKPRYAVGDFLMGRTCAVEVTEVRINEDRGAIYGVAFWDDRGEDPTAPLRPGGGSFWWGESEFKPITDPVLRLRAELTKVSREQAAHVRGLERVNDRFAAIKMALQIATAAPASSDEPAK